MARLNRRAFLIYKIDNLWYNVIESKNRQNNLMTRAHEWENKTTYNVFCLYLLCVMSIGFLIYSVYIVATTWYNKYCKEKGGTNYGRTNS